MPQRNVATNFTFEQQRLEINLLAQDFWSQKTTVDGAASTYLKHDGTNAFTGANLAVPNAFTINSNSGAGTVTISGNLDVTGTTTTVSSANLEVTDKNILIAKGSTSDSQADGAGITIDSATDITFNFVDAKDAWVSSIGIEATTFLKGPYGQFTGSGTPTTGQGVEVNAPDANTGQITSYDRGNSAYKELRVKGSSVGFYTGTTNALAGTFNSTGLTMESGKTITGDLTGTASGNAVLTGSTNNTIATVTGANALTGEANLTFNGSGDLTLKGNDGISANLYLIADRGDDNGDGWRIGSNQDDNDLTIANNESGSYVDKITVLKTGESIFHGIVDTSTIRRRVQNSSVILSGGNATNDGANIALYGSSHGSQAGNFEFRSGSTYVLKIKSDGNIGINEQSPDNKLHITTTSSTAYDTNTSNTQNLTNALLKLENLDGSDGGGVDNYVGIQFSVANGATSSAQLNYVRTADNSGRFAFKARNGNGTVYPNLMDITSDGRVGIGHHSWGQITHELTIRPADDGGISIKRPGDTVSSPNTHLDITTTTAGSAFPSGEAYTVKYKTNNSDQIFETYAGGGTGGNISFRTSTSNTSSESLRITPTRQVLPGTDNTQDLGSPTMRWANLYTGDLNLCNEGSYNEVDGTSGSWTMQEGDSDLFLINRKSGKKYKFNLTEVA